ncbi:MAG: glycosyltransferase family 61 protein [Cyclobacteriaceae bacterium]|nr:glycosyltransferase family 61 protein [Cyclobacteriaceae bacterium]
MKQLLKKIFPVLWLRKIALVINTLKIKTIDRLLYGEYVPAQDEIILLERKNPFLELRIETNKFKPDIRTGFERWQDINWTQDQYIIEIRNKVLTIEAKQGWGIVGWNKLVYYSLGFARAPHVRKPKLILQNLKKKYLPKVISLRDTGEENYFHVYNDVLAKLLLLRDFNLLDSSTYIIVSKALWMKEYFRALVNNSWLKDLNWYVQDNEWVETDHAIFCKPYTHTKRYLEELAAIMKPTNGSQNRILLVRKKSSLRFIENEDEIVEILERYGFFKTDTSGMTLQQQVEVFSNAAHVVAVHGAGITNIIFKKGELKLLELFHHNEYLPFHYIMLARIFGFEYAALRGEKGKRANEGGFYLNPKALEDYCKSEFKNAR